MTTQETFERELAELEEEFIALVALLTERAIRNMRRVNGNLSDILAEVAESDGTVKRRKLSQVLREIERTDSDYREALLAEVESAVREAAEFAVEKRNAIFLSVLGVSLISSVTERKKIVDAVTTRLMRQKGDDLLNLSDRVWILSGDMLADLTKTVRADILKSEAVSTMIRNIRAVQDNDTWKIRRMVVNEANVSLRRATVESAKKSEVVIGVEIVDNRGRHRNHEKHECYKLAEADRYGMGKGRYPLDALEMAELIQPHIQCTSFLRDIVGERYLNGE